MRKIWEICRHSYLDWITSPKQFLFIIEVVFLIQIAIDPLIKVGKHFNSKLNFAEPFLFITNAGLYSFMVAMCYIVLIIELPKVNSNHTFIIWRVGKLKWLAGQSLFLVLSSLTYYGLLFISTFIYTLPKLEFTNQWSRAAVETTRTMNSDILSQCGISATFSEGLLLNTRPVNAIINGFFLMVLGGILIAAVLLVFSLNDKKILGVIAAIFVVISGVGFISMYTRFQWIFPLPHMIYNSHFYAVQTMLKPVWSYVYFFALIAVCGVVSLLSVKKFSLKFSHE